MIPFYSPGVCTFSLFAMAVLFEEYKKNLKPIYFRAVPDTDGVSDALCKEADLYLLSARQFPTK